MPNPPPGTLADAWQFSRAGQFDAALVLATDLVAHDAHNVGALRLLAALTIQNGDSAGGIAMLDRALELAGPIPDLLVELGQAQLSAGQANSALENFRAALALRPKDPAALRGLAQSHQSLGNSADALAAFRAALAILPYDKYAAHMVAALSGSTGPASSDYVADLFDTFADDFDAHLTGNLGYRTPQLIVDMILPYAPASLLDLGCGTGLVGLALTDSVGVIDGVDIAAQMIRKARERGIYRHLRTGDLLETMAGDPDFAGPYDAITAADVLVYLGPLETTFTAVAARLAPQGLFALSIETSTGADVNLLPNGRFAHSPAYIARLSAQAGFAVVEQRAAPIRQERSKPIAGMLYLLRAT